MSPFSKIAHGLRRLWRREEGTATVEMVLMVPIFMWVVFSAFDTGWLQLRSTMLERALDLTVRELRLRQMSNPTLDKVRDEICRLSIVIPDCENKLMVELRPIDTVTYSGLTTQDYACINNDEPIAAQLPPNFNSGSDDQLMLIRVCANVAPMYGSILSLASGVNIWGFGAVEKNQNWDEMYHLVASSAFVNEPS